jgi:hypothetical protein
MTRLILAFAIVLSVFGFWAMTEPQGASAACVASALSLTNSGGWFARGQVGGCGTRTVQVCGINTSGTTQACAVYTNYGTLKTYWSGKLSAAYGCLQRSWMWVSGIGSFYGASYTNIC